MLLSVPLIVLAISAESVALIALAVLVLVLVLAFLALISSTLSGIDTTALSRCGVTGKACGFFRLEMVEQACRQA